MYMLGEINNGVKELISYNLADETFYSMSISVNSGGQIAFGSDGTLFVLAPISEGGTHSYIYFIDTSSGTLTPISDNIIIIDDPFSDISGGRIM